MQTDLANLAGLLGQSVGALLIKQRDAHVCPLLAPRLRALPVLTQVGYIEAVGYCLSQQADKPETKESSKDGEAQLAAEKGISTAISLVGRPGPEFGLKYIPHKVLIDQNGVVRDNFKVDWSKLDALLEYT